MADAIPFVHDMARHWLAERGWHGHYDPAKVKVYLLQVNGATRVTAVEIDGVLYD